MVSLHAEDARGVLDLPCRSSCLGPLQLRDQSVFGRDDIDLDSGDLDLAPPLDFPGG